jgi:hypothetical protein
MKLGDSRLCLDCEEVHEHQICPACGSEAFAFLTRWVQAVDDVRQKAQQTTTETVVPRSRTPEQLEALKQLLGERPRSSRGGLLLKGLFGAAAFGVAGWAINRRRRKEPRDGEPG